MVIGHLTWSNSGTRTPINKTRKRKDGYLEYRSANTGRWICPYYCRQACVFTRA